MSESMMNGGLGQVTEFFGKANDYSAKYRDTEPSEKSREALIQLAEYWNEHRDALANNLRLAAVLSTVGITTVNWSLVTRVAQVSSLSGLYISGEASLTACANAALEFITGDISIEDAVLQATAARQGRPAGSKVSAYEQVLIDWENAVSAGQSFTIGLGNFPKEISDRVKQIKARVEAANNTGEKEKKKRGRPKNVAVMA